MKRPFPSIFVFVFALLAAGRVFASECMATGGAGGLNAALALANGNGCVTDAVRYRNRYGEFFPGTASFNVVKFASSDDISAAVHAIENSSEMPLVIIADPAAVVRFSAGSGGIDIKGKRIILDHVTVEGTAGDGIRISGERNLVIRSRIVSNGANGVRVTGRDNRIVDTEIASNGVNGVSVGGDSAGQSCGSATQNVSGRGTVISNSHIHDNGSRLSGTSCSDADEWERIPSCWSLKMEAEQCAELFAREPDCEEPFVPMGDPCGYFWRSVGRCRDLWSKAGLNEDASSSDAVAAVFDAYPYAHGAAGVFIDAYGVKITSWEPPAEAVDAAPLFKNLIANNSGRDVFVNTMAPVAICKEAEEPFDVNLLQTALVTGTPVGGLFVSRFPLPSIVQLSADGAGADVTVTGNVMISSETWFPWNLSTINMNALRADLYADSGSGMFFAGQGEVDSGGRFSVRVTNAGAGITFVAALVDTEHGNTSPVTGSRQATPGGDDDEDGILNEKEDANHNGRVDAGETDPIDPDTDADGLLDGEESLHTGRVGILLSQNYPFADVTKLDPLNPDSDGDCLPDGLELGASEAEVKALVARKPQKPRYTISLRCQAILTDHTITEMANALIYDATLPATFDNIAMLFDADPATTTDPTSVDTDSDGVRDGNEDFNFNGKRDTDGASGSEWVESDPTLSDADGDGIIDGEEGDKDGDGILGPDESDAHMADTDGDGVSDGQEKRLGTYPNACDSDEDGLSDGVEAGVIKPSQAGNSCHGLEAAGTNYRNPHLMDPLNPDSDSDGLMDGVEDANGNGWIEAAESDPSVLDTDRDGLEDGVEARGDFDGDRIPDFDLRLITGGPKCHPPPDIADIDCDGVPNAIDVDSDDDGCPDVKEGGWQDQNVNTVPDVYDNEAKDCTQGEGGGSFGGIGGGGTSPSESPGEGDTAATTPLWLFDRSGGGACQLVKETGCDKYYTTTILLLCVCLLIGFRRFSVGGGHERSHQRLFFLS